MPKTVKSISMDDSFYRRIARHAKKRHMSVSGWLAQAADEKLAREARVAEEAEEDYGSKGKKK